LQDKILLDFYNNTLHIVGMVTHKAYRFRLYPTTKQSELLAQHFGSCRFVYNRFLRERIDYYVANNGKRKQGLTYNDTAKMLTSLKKTPECVWLNTVNAQALQQSLRCLDVAYNNFFNKRAKFPKFKSKHDKQSFHVPQGFHVDIDARTIRIPKFASMKVVFHREIVGKMKSVTISKAPTGKYFASILCEVERQVELKKTGTKIGIDLGLKSFLVTSNGETVEAPKFLRKSEERLKFFQRRLSRKVKGSANRSKARHRVARIHEKITNQRDDFLHNLSHRLVSENQAIFAEDLYVKGLTENRCLAKSISDAGWGEFVRQLKYKSEWSGVHFGQIDRFFPSSKRCHACGWINQSLTLKDREWTCQDCGEAVDRDVNAAQNILLFGQIQLRADRPKVTLGERRCNEAPR
jgi:putative transposase